MSDKLFDILPMLKLLYNSELISLSFHLRMKKKKKKKMPGVKSFRVLFDSAKVCTLNDLICVQKLQKRYKIVETNLLPILMTSRRNTVLNQEQQFYIQIKRNLDTSTFVNPSDFLKNLVERYTRSIETLIPTSAQSDQSLRCPDEESLGP